jgi:hypothetical protein
MDKHLSNKKQNLKFELEDQYESLKFMEFKENRFIEY